MNRGIFKIYKNSQFSTSNYGIESSTALGTSKSKKEYNKWIGLLLALLSGLLFASVGIIVKYLKGYHVLNIGLFRFLGIFLPALPCTLIEIWKHQQDVEKDSIFEPLKKFKVAVILFVSF